jgi:hypothetical protein
MSLYPVCQICKHFMGIDVEVEIVIAPWELITFLIGESYL